ncbi:putative pentatricopeptide [Rosa chinensis]|uniref:Putative pentatricopeptide n=1 Tax=Rosa chinensis TaxID=74649 RepID=A0A2P6QUJ3_ROSCH|nr:putative pentatricopeptide [Rosa chinensis]
MKLFCCRETAFGFFKLAFRDDNQQTVESCCVAAHVLTAENLRFLAQDVVSCVIGRIGPSRSRDLVGFMWGGHCEYESDFSVLDTLMRGFLNAEMGAEALEVLRRMREGGVRPSLSAVAILFRLLIRVGVCGSLWKVFRDMIREWPYPCNYVFSAMILGFCRKGLVRVGESLLQVMWKFQYEPDVFAYNIVIYANCAGGQTVDTLEWVELMIARGCKPSIVTFNTVISALCKEENVVEARKFFDDVPDMGVFPNTIMYNTMMDEYVKAREIDQASMLFEEMRKKSISPDGITFNIMIGGHYKYGSEDDGDRLLRDLSVSGLLPDSSLYDIYVSVLCWADRLDDAMAVLEDMLERIASKCGRFQLCYCSL